MKQLGLVLVALGLFGAVFAFSLDTTIEIGGEPIGLGGFSITPPKVRVQNFDLIERRRIFLYTSGLAILVGVILFGFGSIQNNLIVSKGEAQSPSDADVKTEQSVASGPVSVQHFVLVLCPKCGNAESVPESESHTASSFKKFISKDKWGFITLAVLRMTCKNCGHKFIFDPDQDVRKAHLHA